MITELSAGFLPLTDSAILIAARELGFAEAEGIALNLVRETSWANVRDKLAVGQFEISHALAPMPIAANLGLTPFDTRLIAPMALGLGGNAITVSNSLLARMQDGSGFSGLDATAAGRALAEVVDTGKSRGAKPLQFSVVHPFSGHNFELRYWLSASGIIPDTDIEVVILPPSLMADALASGQIDGYCVGEPWNSVGVARAAGRIVTTKSSIWASSPEKVLAVREDWAGDNADTLHALLRALYRSAEWCGQPIWISRPSSFCRRWTAPSLERQFPAEGVISSSRMPAPRPFPGRATPCGSIRKWCAAVTSAIPPRTPKQRARATGRTSTAR